MVATSGSCSVYLLAYLPLSRGLLDHMAKRGLLDHMAKRGLLDHMAQSTASA